MDAMQSLQRHLTKKLYDCPLYTATTSAEFNLIKVPERVLDAPHMKDDFYAHPVSWSRKNMLAIETCQSVVYCNMDSGELEQFKDVSVFERLCTTPQTYFFPSSPRSKVLVPFVCE